MSRLIPALALTAALMVPGCSGDDLATLTGTVTIDGKPAPEGLSIEFAPIDGPGSPSSARTDADGNYVAMFTFKKEGIQPGRHRVHLMPSQIERPMPQIGPDGKPLPSEADEAIARFGKLPEKYWREIEIITIEPGANTKNIDLKTGDDSDTDGDPNES